MCHLSVEIDQAVHTVAPVFDIIDESEFYVRSIRVVPVAWTKKASIHLSLGGGSKKDLTHLLASLHGLPGVLSTHHTSMPF